MFKHYVYNNLIQNEMPNLFTLNKNLQLRNRAI